MHLAALALGVPAGAAPPAPAQPAPAPALEHGEFDAMLEAAFRAPLAGRSRTFIVHFTRPGGPAAHSVNWSLRLRRRHTGLVRQWRGRHAWRGDSSRLRLNWRAPAGLPPGIYELTLQAGNIRQRRPIAIGNPTPLLAAGATLAAATPARLAGLPFDIVYGNLHSQSNHSDGGGDPATCHGAQQPRTGAFGPQQAYQFARQHGLQFLVTSEHNHMYDASAGSAPAADPLAARQLYRLGIDGAGQYTEQHPGFVALYGVEWGIISGGGHLNIFNSPALLGWERSSGGEPFADVVTPKNDYAALYTLMREQGWLGQFNHPARSQFPIGGQAPSSL
jgi:hypothetical protein